MLERLRILAACGLLVGCGDDRQGGSFGDGEGGDAADDGSTGDIPASTSQGDDDDDDDDDDATSTMEAESGQADTMMGPLLDVGPGETTGPTSGPCEDMPEPVVAASPCADASIAISRPFDAFYKCRDLGAVPGVMPEVGGVTFSIDDDDVLWIGGRANHVQGRLYAIAVSRDPACHVNGFAEEEATEIGTAPYNDGGVAYGPMDALFLAQWPQNELSIYMSGATDPTVELALGTVGVGPDSIAGLTFVPPTFAGEGQLKVVTWPGGDWFTLELMDDGMGAYGVVDAVAGPALGGGPEGIVYVSAENVGVDVESVLVAEYLDGSVALYETDGAGDPIVDTRQDFIVGLEGALGAHLDRVAGDFLFSTFGGGDRLIAVRGFVPNPEPEG